jgi:hypothetical protein
MLTKVYAWTCLGYIRDITNQVDFLVVVTGLVDLALVNSKTEVRCAGLRCGSSYRASRCLCVYDSARRRA